MQDFGVEGVQEMFECSDFRGSERNFTIWQRSKISGNFSNMHCYNLEATGVGCVNLGPGDPSLDYTNSVWNCAKELAGGG